MSTGHSHRWASVLYSLHRRLGAIAAVFVLLLSVSGVALNHTDSLALARKEINWRPLMDYYGLHQPMAISYTAGESRVVQIGEGCWVNDISLECQGSLVGVLEVGVLLTAAFQDHILLLTKRGEIVERIGSESGISMPIDGLGRDAQGAIRVRSAAGEWVGDSELLVWTPTAPVRAVHWSKPSSYTGENPQTATVSFSPVGLPLERILLDLHSGRIFGTYGPWLMDLAALMMALLAISGVWIRLRQRRQQRRRRRRSVS
ncbi:MAG: PepSY-associated TM helix domain-containing protein [Chromatiales bacterium]|nr:PepSY-associated TM helix domain-containing protein [Chromatiales bacterium]